MKRIDLLAIDVQNDFVLPTGSLSVPGALEDAKRLARMIDRLGKKLTNLHFSLDSHQVNQIFHPAFWLDKNNRNTNPFTPISNQEVQDGMWRTAKKSHQAWGLKYTEELERKGRYGLFIWPVHCLIYSHGWLIEETVANALRKWETDFNRNVNFLVKGNSPFTENYSIFQAEVPYPGDPSTQLNTDTIEIFQDADEIPVAGQALSHCVAWSAQDLADNFGEENIKKMVLLEDATSSVPNFEQQGKDFIKNMTARGMRISNTVDYLS